MPPAELQQSSRALSHLLRAGWEPQSEFPTNPAMGDETSEQKNISPLPNEATF